MTDPAAVAELVWAESTVADRRADELSLWRCLEFCRKWGQGARKAAWAAVERAAADRLAEANLGLVYRMAKRFPAADRDDLISDGMLVLTRAIRGFRPGMGNRFTTYACNGLARAMYRVCTRSGRRAGLVPILHHAPPTTDAPERGELDADDLRRMMADLPAIDRRVLRRRYGMGCPRQTYQAIGDEVGLSKERVRQIQNRAIKAVQKTVRRAGIAIKPA